MPFPRGTLFKKPFFGNGKDKKYLQALKDVRARGIRPDLTGTLPGSLFGRRRDSLETLQGIYWAYDGANRLGTPPRLYNQIVRSVAKKAKHLKTKKKNDEGDNARLFAFVNAAMADAGILAWEQKYCHDFWRPVLGIREHDENLGPKAPYAVGVNFYDGDPGWLPLGAPSTNSPGMKNFTPNFPAYPSGHATFGAAALHMTRIFYGVDPEDKSKDSLFDKEFFVSDEFNGGNRDNEGAVRPRHTRFFPNGLWQMIIENAISRVFLGVHWIFDAFDFTEDKDGNLVPDLADEEIGGVGLGLRIARDIWVTGGMKAPKRTPEGVAEPPITTPVPEPMKPTPMPVAPQQPASVKGCADHGKMKSGAAQKEAIQEEFPPGASEQGQAEAGSQVQSAYPSGISEKH